MGPRYRAAGRSEHCRQGLKGRAARRRFRRARAGLLGHSRARTPAPPWERPCGSRPREGHRRRAPDRRDRFALNRGSEWGWWVVGGMRRESLEDDVDMAQRVRSSARPRSTVRNCHVTTSTKSYVPRLTLSSQLLLDQRAALGTTDLRAGGGLAWIDVSALLIRQLGGPTWGTWCILVNVASLVGVEVPVTLAPFTAQRLEGAHHSFGGERRQWGLPNKTPTR